MSQAKQGNDAESKWNLRSPWVSVVAVAVLAGMMLPLLMPTSPTPPSSASPVPLTSVKKAESKESSKREYAPPPMPEAPNLREMVGRLVYGTILVLGLCVGAMWIMRRWMQPTLATENGQRKLQLAESLHLGNRCFLHLVQLGEQQILVGVDPAGIKSVSTIARAFDEVLAEQPVVEPPILPAAAPSSRLAA